MATAREMATKWNNLVRGLPSHAEESIRLIDDKIIDKLQTQLQRGEDGLGNQLQPYRSEEYADYKLSLNPRGVTDLRLTGSLYNHMVMVIMGSYFNQDYSIISTDDKFLKLMKKYGYQTMELQQQSIEEIFKQNFQPSFVQFISDYTGAGITKG